MKPHVSVDNRLIKIPIVPSMVQFYFSEHVFRDEICVVSFYCEVHSHFNIFCTEIHVVPSTTLPGFR